MESDTNQKIIFRLKGGLGNQLFIYSYALYLIDKLNVNISFDQHSGFLLNKFRHQTTKPLLNFFFDNIKGESVLKQLFFFMSRKKITKNLIYNNDESLSLSDIQSNKAYNYYLEGYFQNLKYVNPFLKDFRRAIIRQQNNLTNEIKKLITLNNSVGFHLRVNDYGIDTDISYLTKSYDFFIQERIQNFYLFTDNEDWCKENLPNFNNFKIVNTGSDLNDFLLMSMLDNHALTIGTFGWWAAIIKEDGKTTVSSEARLITPLLYPDNWIYL
jgi:hypothetical protein